MVVLVIADIHANMEALQAVLDSAGAFDCVWVLGDTVGYGPEPCAAIDRVRELPHVNVLGNHDAAAVGIIDTSLFNPIAAEANHWTAGQLTPEQRDYLAACPRTLERDGATLCHGSLRDPLLEYLFDEDAARAHLQRQHTPIGFVGHTHVPLVFRGAGRRLDLISPRPPLPAGAVLQLGDLPTVVNPGGVGQPRDGDPRAAFALYDTERRTVTFRRVAYDVPATQRKIRAAGLPESLALRLARGV